MAKKSYFEILKYPLATWLVIDIILFGIGFTSFVGLSTDMLLGNGALVFAVLFGLWIGRRTSKAFTPIWASMLTAIMLTIVTGFAGLLVNVGLNNYSSSFASYMSQYGPSSSITSIVINGSITIWIEVAMIALVAAAMACEFSLRTKLWAF